MHIAFPRDGEGDYYEFDGGFLYRVGDDGMRHLCFRVISRKMKMTPDQKMKLFLMWAEGNDMEIHEDTFMHSWKGEHVDE